MEENSKTHDLIFKYLSKKKLNELLLRADKGVLEEEINKRLKGFTNLIAKAKVSTNETDNKCSLYVNYYNSQNKQVGHISLHFSPKSPGKNPSTIGRMHPKNNRNTQRRYTLRFNDKENTIRMSLFNNASRS